MLKWVKRAIHFTHIGLSFKPAQLSDLACDFLPQWEREKGVCVHAVSLVSVHCERMASILPHQEYWHNWYGFGSYEQQKVMVTCSCQHRSARLWTHGIWCTISQREEWTLPPTFWSEVCFQKTHFHLASHGGLMGLLDLINESSKGIG